MELIDREEAIKTAQRAHFSGTVGDRIRMLLEGVPTIESRPKGKWIESDNYGDLSYICDRCNSEYVLIDGTPSENGYNYCPNCGAEMEK